MLRSCLTILLTLVSSVAKVVAEEPARIPSSMAVLGDSISEGMLAGFSLDKRPTMAQLAKLYWISTENDPIKKRDSYRANFARRDMSWATGDNSHDLVESHYERLKAANPNLVAYNFAISGQESFALDEEIRALNQVEQEIAQPIEYVMIMIGANDLASEHSLEITIPTAYVMNIERGLRNLLDRSSDRSIYIVGLPEVHEVFESSYDYIVYSSVGGDLKCKSMRRQIYGEMTIFHPENAPEYRYTKDLLKQYRDGLQDLSVRLAIEYPEARFKFIRSVGKPTNVRKALSIDCFHPSEWGQAELAEITWNGGFWPHLQNGDWSVWASTLQTSD